MRIVVIATVGGLLAATALASPLVPSGTISNKIYAPAGEVVPEMLEASAHMANNVLRVATLREPVPRQPIDFDNLIRIDGKDYDVAYSENFSDEVQSISTVRKIGFGNLKEVSVITTPSGTYSTDGLASRHVRYPDIETQRAAAKSHKGLLASVWHSGFGWLPQTFGAANSIITFGPIKGGGAFISGNGSTCFKGPTYYTCN